MTKANPTSRPVNPFTAHDLKLAYGFSLVVALLVAVVSAAGLVAAPAGLYGTDPKAASGIVPYAAGVLVPGFLAHDGFNLAVAVPLLLGSIWLARQGSLAGLLAWPGVLFYVLYTYVTYVAGAPFSVLFVPYAGLVAMSAYTTAGIVASIDASQVRQRLSGSVPARTAGGILVALALLTVGQDASGAIATALAGGSPAVPIARHIWIADLVLEVPAVLAGGVLLWRRNALGYVVGAGLLLQYGVTPTALATIMLLQPILTGSPVDTGTVVALLMFSLVCFAPLALFVRGARRQPEMA